MSSKTPRFVAVLSLVALCAALEAPRAASAQASARGPISNLKFAIEEAAPVRRNDPVWIANGGAFALGPGQSRNIRAAADGAGGRVYPSVTFTVTDGGDWLSLDDPHPNMGTVRVNARAGAGTGRSGAITWTLASGFQPADGVQSGVLYVNSPTASGGGVMPGAPMSAQQVVADLYRAILLREPDPAAEGFYNRVTREGYAGAVRVGREMSRSTESRTQVPQRGVSNEDRLTALYRHLLGFSRADVSVADWMRNLDYLNQGKVDQVVWDLQWTDRYFARTGYSRPTTRP
jgi:hypothetical protein